MTLLGRLAALGAVATLAASCDRDPAQPGWESMADMAHSVAYDSFAPNPVTRDGKTLLAPPAGAIARGRMPFRYGAGPDEAARAGRELGSPVPPGPEASARGEKLFRSFCFPCHGAAGQGDGPIIPLFPTPPSLTADHARRMPDGQIFHVMSRGQGVMPSHATQIDPLDRWMLVHHVRNLQRAAVPPPPAARPPAAAPAATAPGGAP